MVTRTLLNIIHILSVVFLSLFVQMYTSLLTNGTFICDEHKAPLNVKHKYSIYEEYTCEQ